MIFHWCVSHRKSPQVSRTFLSILVNLKNIVVFMDLICLLISNSSSFFFKSSGTVPCVSITIIISVNLIFSQDSYFSGKVFVFASHFVFFDFSLCCLSVQQIPQCGTFSLFFSSGRDLKIYFYFKISEKFLCFILQVRSYFFAK